MRIFLIEWSFKVLGLTEVAKRLRGEGHEIIYWSGYNLDANVDKKEFPQTIFHDYHDARLGRPSPQVDDTSFPPPSEELITSMWATEALLLPMMEKRFEWMGVNEKKHLYYRYLQYWDGVIKKYKPDLLIGPSATHTIYDLVLFDLARKYGIQTLMFEQTAVGDRSIVMNDFRVGSAALMNQLAKDERVTYSVEDFEPDIRQYWDKHLTPDSKPTPLIVKQTLARYSPLKVVKLKIEAVIKSIRNKHFFYTLFHRILRWGVGTMSQEYNRLAQRPDLNAKFIYVPLHYQPECTTSPLGGLFVDQLLMIETLAHSLPEGWKIYVKEQPFQWKIRGTSYFSFRYKGFYESIAKLKNVQLVPIDTDSFTLIKHAITIASVAGTAPWEGALRGKPGIVFGYPWYRGCKGIFQVHSVEECREVLEKIKNGFVVEKQTMINFLGSFQKGALNCFRDAYNQKLSPLTVEQNIENILTMIRREITIE